MKRYSVHEYPLGGLLSGVFFDRMHDGYEGKDSKGGIIVFPEDMAFVDSSIAKKMRSKGNYFIGRTASKDGTVFSEKSICIEVGDMYPGNMMLLAMTYCRIYQRTVLLKDCNDKKVYSVKYNEIIDIRKYLVA